jgi:hypothetical protein
MSLKLHTRPTNGFMLRRFGLDGVSMRSDWGAPWLLFGRTEPYRRGWPMADGRWQAGTAGATHSACIPSSFAQRTPTWL